MAKYTVYRVSDGGTVAYCPTLERAMTQAAYAARHFDGTFEILEAAPGIRRILNAQGQFLRNQDDEMPDKPA